MIKLRNDEYYDMYEDDTLSPEEVARRAAGRALDMAHTKLVAVLDDLNTIQQVHYAACFREISPVTRMQTMLLPLSPGRCEKPSATTRSQPTNIDN